MAAQFASYNDGYILDAFSFSYVAKSLASGDFELMKTAASYSYDENFAKTAQMLSELDLNSVDMICVMYDGSDYINKRPCDDPNALYAEITYTGALRSGVKGDSGSLSPYPHRGDVPHLLPQHRRKREFPERRPHRSGARHPESLLQKELDATMDVSVSFIDNFLRLHKRRQLSGLHDGLYSL